MDRGWVYLMYSLFCIFAETYAMRLFFNVDAVSNYNMAMRAQLHGAMFLFRLGASFAAGALQHLPEQQMVSVLHAAKVLVMKRLHQDPIRGPARWDDLCMGLKNGMPIFAAHRCEAPVVSVWILENLIEGLVCELLVRFYISAIHVCLNVVMFVHFWCLSSLCGWFSSMLCVHNAMPLIFVAHCLLVCR